MRLWDTHRAVAVAVLSGHQIQVSSIAFSPDGRRFASASADKTVRIWVVDRSEEVLVLSGHESSVDCVAFSPDGRRVASGSKDETVRLWDAESGVQLAVLRGHGHFVTSVAFSPDNQRVQSVSESNDRSLLWDVESGKLLGQVPRHTNAVPSQPSGFPDWHVSVENGETLIRPGSGAEDPVARFHEAVRSIRAHPDGRTWVGAVLSHVVIVRLEGNVKMHPRAVMKPFSPLLGIAL